MIVLESGLLVVGAKRWHLGSPRQLVLRSLTIKVGEMVEEKDKKVVVMSSVDHGSL